MWNPGTAHESVERAPVVAWRTSEGAVVAAVALGFEWSETASEILCPNGRVIDIGCAEYQTVDDWATAKRRDAAAAADSAPPRWPAMTLDPARVRRPVTRPPTTSTSCPRPRPAPPGRRMGELTALAGIELIHTD